MRTRVGYAGGEKDNPTYHSLGDHTETVELDFDPNQISYKELLNIFWESHHPTVKSCPKQYMSIILYHNEKQREQILETKKDKEDKLSTRLYTEIQSYSKFFRGEDFHQKFYLQKYPELMDELKNFYNSFRELVDSTAAARINGYLAGYGSENDLLKDLPLLGLSERGQKYLRG
ncbi:methionine sulfoxide reductase [Natranaerobius trueperi]|uniref:peptide-methionine (S)-S-oxide reductase n=1 Tax=Natranaerobius trueperi TaxID=759412 RepID=A0A226C139_9FIRM|nr:methionine sulfoxide reductase [Natranaerobius trueperi]